jgi:hypothetical protein
MVLARRRGLDFETWWAEAVREKRPLIMTNHPHPPEGCIRWPTDVYDRRAWQSVIYSTKEGWRRVYERIAPTAAERALEVLAESIGALAQVAEERSECELADALPAHDAILSAA